MYLYIYHNYNSHSPNRGIHQIFNPCIAIGSYFLTCLTMRTELTFHSIFVRVTGMRRRIERKVSWLMLVYMSSRPLCRIDSWVCRNKKESKNKVNLSRTGSGNEINDV